MPIQIDQRTRRDEDVRSIVRPNTFFKDEFPELARSNGQKVIDGIEVLQAPRLTIEVDGTAWTVHGYGGKLCAEPRHVDGSVTVTLTQDQFTAWAQNLISLQGLLVSRELAFRGGSLADISTWDSLWLALLEGWPLTDPELSFHDLAGMPLDLERSFCPWDDPREIAHFLREAGYVRLRRWLDPNDIARISKDMDQALPEYADGDGKSWWATLQDGSRACVRLLDFVERSPATAATLTSEAWERIVRMLEGPELFARKPASGQIVEALFKPIGVVSGPSDLSFHRDCHLGRHSYACSRMTLGIAVTASGAANGMLRVIAGSHRLAMPVELAKTRPYLPIVALPTEPGDVTVHLSCTLHEATPPIRATRKVLYTEIPLREADGYLIDTTVEVVRSRVNELLRRP